MEELKKQIAESVEQINDENYLGYLLVITESVLFDYQVTHQQETQQSSY